MRVLAIGEVMAEMAPADTAGDFRLGFAGDTFNTAWYLAKCAPDVTVSYLTVVGDDAISQNLTDFMRASRIDDRFLQTSPDRTIGLYLIALDNGERSFSYWRGQSAAKTLANDPDRLDAAMAEADLIYFSGITLAILDPEQRTVLLSALRDARGQGKVIAFDPNLRPKLWGSSEIMTNTIMQGAGVSDIVLPSFEDEASWFKDSTPQATAQRYQNAGATTIIVKNGEAPALYAEGSQSGEVPVVPVAQIIDTTAAGDSFNAGVLAGHALGMSLHDGVAYACSLSREVVQQKGALVEIDLAPETILRLRQASTASVATLLFKRGYHNAYIQGVLPLSGKTATMVGPAYTLRYIPTRPDTAPLDAFRDPDHPQRVAVEHCPTGAVLIMDCRQDASAASAGSILLTRCQVRGVAGVVSDGGIRDAAGAAALDMPVFAAKPFAPTNLTKHHAVDIGLPIACGGVAVYPGDILLGDGDGVMVIPRHLADEIAAETVAMELFEAFVLEEVTGGASIRGLYPPTDPKALTRFEEWKAKKDA